MFKRSQALDAVLADVLETKNSELLCEALSITTGYDNDGSTGIDMVEIGIGLGVEMAQMAMEKGQAEVWLAKHPREHKGWPIVAANEEDAIAFLKSF